MWPRFSNNRGGGMYSQNQNSSMNMLQNKMQRQQRFNSQVRNRFTSTRPPYDNKRPEVNVPVASAGQGNGTPVENKEVNKAPEPNKNIGPTSAPPTDKPAANINKPNASTTPSAPASLKDNNSEKQKNPVNPPLPIAPATTKPPTPSENVQVKPEPLTPIKPNQYQQNQNKPYQQNKPNQYQQNKPNQYQQNQDKPNQYQQNQDKSNQNKPNQYQQNQDKPNQNKPNQYQQNQDKPNQNKPNQYQQNQNKSDQYQSNNQYRQNQSDQYQAQNKSDQQPKTTGSTNDQYQQDQSTDQNKSIPYQQHQNKNNRYQSNNTQTQSNQQKSYSSDAQQKHPYQSKWHGNQQGSNDSWKRSEGGNSYNKFDNYDNRQQYRGGPGLRGGYPGADRIREKLENTIYAPLIDLAPYDISEKKFNVFAKLFVGNIPKNVEEEEVLALFREYGEIGPVYFSKESSFAFITFDFKANAAKAVKGVDDKCVRNRPIKVRFATINEGIRVKNLSKNVSNELLEKAFSIFGQIENCRVVVDDRGMPKNEGVVIFKEKRCAAIAIKKCQEECFFLTGSLRPVVVTAVEPIEDPSEGLSEELLIKDDEYKTERESIPHFADPASFEHEFGSQWIKLFTMYDQKKSVLDSDFKIEIERLEKKLVLARVEYETDKLRKELAQREAETEQLRRHFGSDELASHYGGTGYGGVDRMAPGYDTSYGTTPGYDSYEGAAVADYDMGYGASESFSGGYKPKMPPYDRNAGGYGAEVKYEKGFDSPSEASSLKRSVPPTSYESSYDTQAPAKTASKRPRY